MRIRDRDYIQKLITTISARDPGEQGAPVDIAEDVILPVLDIGPFLPQTEVVLPTGGLTVLRAGDDLGLDTGEFFIHAGQRTSPAGGAGQFSGLGDIYESIAAAQTVTRLELLYLHFIASVASYLRLYYITVDVFGTGAQGRNLKDGSLSARSTFVDWGSQTATPEVLAPPNHSGAVSITGAAGWGTGASALFRWDTGFQRPLLGRAVLPAQTQALAWGVWAQATVTAIAVDYMAIWRQVPTP